MSVKSKIAILFVVFALAACGRASDGPRIETSRLDNGLDIIVIPDFRADVVTHIVPRC